LWNRDASADYHFADGCRDATEKTGIGIGAKKRMSIDEVKNGQRINCHGVYGTVIGKRSTPKRRFVLVKLDNGFTLNLDVDTLSANTGDIPPRHAA
jgi:hypothetical protein